MRLRALARKSNDGCRKSYPERPRLDHADVGIVESSKGLSGEVVVAARLHRGHTLPEAGKRERMVADGADVVLGLPDTPPLDARTRVERVDDAPPEEVSRGRWFGRLLPIRRLAEQQAEPWAGGTKMSRRRHREVELKRVREEKDAVDGRTALEIRKVHGVELGDERTCPVSEHLSDRHVVGDGEREVEVGEAVAAVDGERATAAPATERSSSSARRSTRSRTTSRCSTVNTSASLWLALCPEAGRRVATPATPAAAVAIDPRSRRSRPADPDRLDENDLICLEHYV